MTVKNNRAFTLVELLLVVLIIGILAAIAVPQYQVTVDKSRYIQAMQIVDGLVKAQKIYYMENGHFADSFEELAVEPPTPPTPQTGFKYNYPWGSCKLYRTGAGGANCSVLLGSNSVDYAVEINPYSRRCWVGKEDSRGQRLCRAITNSTTAYNAGGEYYYSFN